ncbi:hypothetical protein [Amycolatopsis sp. TNS106]|uniref:hypothetical protein n=1 Tax=Amycolatopsis sp. TNS106 TaxID=2861750 RepID=UPI001C58CFAE|nr:hypothetical protein [Amycolatopsis sp. TNS106]QXV57388.1 hypothetical protein CVV72_10440 [Amycolatopsis sp. TNS106]
MTNDQLADQQHSSYGSSFARMFGYVTPEDRNRWEQQREQNRPRVNAAKLAMKASVASTLEFGERTVHARLDAAHRVAAQREFDTAHNKAVRKRRDPGSQSIIETVDYEPKDQRSTLDPDLEL